MDEDPEEVDHRRDDGHCDAGQDRPPSSTEYGEPADNENGTQDQVEPAPRLDVVVVEESVERRILSTEGPKRVEHVERTGENHHQAGKRIQRSALRSCLVGSSVVVAMTLLSSRFGRLSGSPDSYVASLTWRSSCRWPPGPTWLRTRSGRESRSVRPPLGGGGRA